MFLAIDLSLRSTGLVCIKQDQFDYKLVTSDSKKINDEKLLIYNWNEIEQFINKNRPTYIAIEGLSFGSLSSSKDILAGNFWYVRTKIAELYPDVIVDIIPVLTWRSPLFNKQERLELKENTKKFKELKVLIKEVKFKEEKNKILLDNEMIIERSNIKYLTWEKLPEPIKSKFHKIGFNKGGFDLTDAYFIAKYVEVKYA